MRTRSVNGQSIEVDVPFYDIDGEKVWGATAMVLAEFVRVCSAACMTPWSVSPLAVAAVVLAVPGGLLVLAGLVALRRRRPFRFVLRTLLGLLMLDDRRAALRRSAWASMAIAP